MSLRTPACCSKTITHAPPVPHYIHTLNPNLNTGECGLQVLSATQQEQQWHVYVLYSVVQVVPCGGERASARAVRFQYASCIFWRVTTRENRAAFFFCATPGPSKIFLLRSLQQQSSNSVSRSLPPFVLLRNSTPLFAADPPAAPPGRRLDSLSCIATRGIR